MVQQQLLAGCGTSFDQNICPCEIEIFSYRNMVKLDPWLAGHITAAEHLQPRCVGTVYISGERNGFFLWNKDHLHMGIHLDTIPHGSTFRISTQIAGHLPKILEIIRIHFLHSGQQHRNSAVPQLFKTKPAPQRTSKQFCFFKCRCFLFIQPFIRVSASACIHSVRNLVFLISQDPHCMDTGCVAIRDRIGGTDDVGHRPVPGICIFDTGDRPISAAAASVYISVWPVYISVDLLCLDSGVFRSRRTGTVRDRIIRCVRKNCTRPHVRLY